jgi:hypothetical protein
MAKIHIFSEAGLQGVDHPAFRAWFTLMNIVA